MSWSSGPDRALLAAIWPVTILVGMIVRNLVFDRGTATSFVIVATLFFARRVAHFSHVVPVTQIDDDTCLYAVRGVLFFASSNDLVYQFDYVNDPTNVIIDLTDAQIYDSSTVAALDAIVLKYHQKGKHVEIVGIDEHSARWHALSGTLSNH